MSASPQMPLPIIGADGDFIGALLREQHSMTAVEQFSRDHQSAEKDLISGPAQASFYRRLMPATGPGPNQQFAFEVDLDSCSGCKACVVACHTLNGLEDQEIWRRVGTLVGEDTVQHVTTACHHCEDPGCLKGCPVKAYVKDETTGVVRHLDDQCIGCKYCTMMCPYEVPQYSERLGIVRKCDMCHQRLQVGEAPACVQACPNEAIRIRVVDRNQCGDDSTGVVPAAVGGAARASGTLSVSRLAPGAPDSSITRPTTTYQSRRPSIIAASTPQDAAVDRVGESHWPLAVMLVGTQAAIGLILIERLSAWGMGVTGGAMPTAVTRATVTMALVLAGLGLNVAPLHLGHPLKAWRIFLGLRTSWLSREAILLGVFLGLLGAASGLLWLPLAGDAVPASMRAWFPLSASGAVLAASVPVGLAGLYASGMVYIATRRQLWRFQRTMARFAGSAVCLGLFGFAFASCLASERPAWFIPAALLGLAASAAKYAFETVTHYTADLERTAASANDGSVDFDARSARLAMGPLRGWVQYRRFAAVISMLLLASAVLIGADPATTQGVASGSGRLVPTLCLAVAFAVCLVGDIAERLLYFASVVYDRMPGTLR